MPDTMVSLGFRVVTFVLLYISAPFYLGRGETLVKLSLGLFK